MIFVEFIEDHINFDFYIFYFNNSNCLLYFFKFIFGTYFLFIMFYNTLSTSEQLRYYLLFTLFNYIDPDTDILLFSTDFLLKLILVERLEFLVSDKFILS